MSLNRRALLMSTGALLAAPFVLRPHRAGAAEVTLRLHHFLPAVSNAHRKLLDPWAKKVAEASGNRLRIDIFPAMQLGGTPPQLYDQARDGVADIVWTLPGSTPGRFPSTEAFELPFIAAERAMVNAVAAQDFADTHITTEVADVKLLAFWTHDAGHIHARRPVATMADLRGLKLRNPTRLAGEALKALGAVSVGMPIPQVPESLAQGVIDGCVIPWEVVPAVKVHELVSNHLEITGSPTLYTASFFLAMNRPRYESLPDDLRRVIDGLSGRPFAEMAGAMWDGEAAAVRKLVADRGNRIVTLADDERARWIEATRPVEAAWLEAMAGRGIDGAKLAADARALIARHAGRA